MVLATLDTNILLAGLRSSRGASFQVLKAMEHRLFVPAISVALFLEYEAVLTRPEQMTATNMSTSDVESLLEALATLAQQVGSISCRWRPLLSDPKDDMVVDCAVSSGSEYLVTMNRRDFEPARQFSLELVSPLQFLQVVRN